MILPVGFMLDSMLAKRQAGGIFGKGAGPIDETLRMGERHGTLPAIP
jgi:hypothetical protein